MLCITHPSLSSIHLEVSLRWPHRVWCDCVSQCQHTLDRSCCVSDILVSQFAGFTTPLLICAAVPACSNMSKMNISVVSISNEKTRHKQLTKKYLHCFLFCGSIPIPLMLVKEVFQPWKDGINAPIMTFLCSRKTVGSVLHDQWTQRTRAVVFPVDQKLKNSYISAKTLQMTHFASFGLWCRCNEEKFNTVQLLMQLNSVKLSCSDTKPIQRWQSPCLIMISARQLIKENLEVKMSSSWTHLTSLCQFSGQMKPPGWKSSRLK